MEKTTVSKKGTIIGGGMTTIGGVALALKDTPTMLYVIAALTMVLIVYLCVQGFLDYEAKNSDVPKL